MAMSASIIWEYRDTATANMVNGGGFTAGASGVDHSTDDGAVTNWSKADGASSASTTFTSATATFDSNIVGNILHLTIGTGATVGWYEVTGYTDANTITLDRVSGTYTGATFYVGGALNVGGSLEDSFFEQCVAGQTVYIKSGTYTPSQSISTTTVGTASLPIAIEGYQTTRGDNATGANRPLIAMGANTLFLNDYFHLFNLRTTITTAAGVQYGTGVLSEDVFFENTSGTANRPGSSSNDGSQRYINCEFKSAAGYGASSQNADNNITFIGCYFHDSVIGLAAAGSGMRIINSIFDTNTTGFTSGTTRVVQLLLNNTFYNSSTAGISGSSATLMVALNNIFDTCGTGVTFTAQADSNWFDYNNYFNNTTDRTNVMTGDHDTALDPGFTNAANGDFSITGDI